MNNLDKLNFSEKEFEKMAAGCRITISKLKKAIVKYELSTRETINVVDLVENCHTNIFTVAKFMKSYSLATIACALEVRNELADERDEKGRLVYYKPSLTSLLEYIELFHDENISEEDVLGQIEEFGLYNGVQMKNVIRVAKENKVAGIEVATRIAFGGKKRDILNDPLLINDPETKEDDFKFNVVEGHYE